MAWTRFTFTDYLDCADKLAAFLTRTKQPGTVTPDGGNTGDGIIFGLSTTAASVTEDFTITCKTAGASAVFSVVGTVSGALADATINIPYITDKICFTIIGGDTNFAEDDEFTFSVDDGTPNWIEMRNETRRDAATGKEYVFKGIGDGDDEIYIGIRTLTNGTTYWNWNLQAFTGYIEANAFENLPGYYNNLYTCFPNTGSAYAWVFESARRVIVIPTPTGDYNGQVHLGWLLPTATPSQWGNPLFVGGDTTSATRTYTESRAAWWNTQSRSRIYDGGSWDLNSDIWPYKTYTPVKDINGDLPLDPVTVIKAESVDRKIYGEVEGCFSVAADGGSVGTGDTIISEDKQEFYIITKNVSLAGDKNIMAIKLT